MRWHSPLRRSFLGAVTTVVALSFGCGPAETPAPHPTPETPAETLQVELDDAFVAVPRKVSAQKQEEVRQRLDGAERYPLAGVGRIAPAPAAATISSTPRAGRSTSVRSTWNGSSPP